MNASNKNLRPEPDMQALERPLTAEQIAIINSSGNIRINAVAGSGKTTTIIEYAATRPHGSKILYLAFNKSVRLEAIRKFRARGLLNVKIETAHSLAYKYIVYSHGYNVNPKGHKTQEIADLLELRGNGEKHTVYILANHINKFCSYFCNSDKSKLQEVNYLDKVSDNKARAFVKSFYAYIEDRTSILLAKMDRGEIDITHDFYLKKFQLSAPLLPYDYILFDEGQDTSGAMLDVFLKQRAIKVIVGDVHQQIYAWRHAINSLEKTNFTPFQLSASFRFPEDIADLASNILNWKKHLYYFDNAAISGKGTNNKEISKATIARTNLGLLLKAIEYVKDHKKVRHIYFEGNINSYTYADSGASLNDVLNLFNKKHDRIQDKIIKSMKDLNELEEYIEKTEDVQLSMMAELAKEYGNEIHGIIKSLKDLHIGDEEKDKAEMIFSTVHRSKGMEYDVVYLVDDFITEEKLEKLIAIHKEKEETLNITKLNEEINLLYVAVTRTRNKLYIPKSLFPKDFHLDHHMSVKKEKNFSGTLEANLQVNNLTPYKQLPANKNWSGIKDNEKAYTVFEKRRSHKDAYQPWTSELDKELKEMADRGASVSSMAEHFGRTKGAIYSRLKKLDYFSH